MNNLSCRSTHMLPLAQNRGIVHAKPSSAITNALLPVNGARFTRSAIHSPLGPCLLPGRQRHRRCLVPQTAATAAAAAELPASANPPEDKSEKVDPIALALEILRPDAPLVALTTLTLLATVFVTLAFPLAIGDIFDVVRQHLASLPDNALLPPLEATSLWGSLVQTAVDVRGAAATAPAAFHSVLLRLGVCLILSATGNAAVAFLAPMMGERFGLRMRKRLMEETLSKDQSFFDATPKGDIVSRLTLDVTTLQATISDFLGQRGIRSMLEVTCSLAIIATKNPLLAVVSFVVTPALSTVLRRVVTKAAKLTYERQQAAAAAMEFASDRLTHVRTVQLFAQEEREGAAYAALAARGYSLAGKCAAFQGLVEGAGRFAVNIGTLTLLGLGGALVLSGRISLGTLLAFQVYNLFLSVGLASLAASVGDLGKALGAMERVAEVAGASGRDPAAVASTATRTSTSSTNSTSTAAAADTTYNGHRASITEAIFASPLVSSPSVLASASQQEGGGASIELKDVWFKYPSREDWALQGLTLHVPAGETFALVGRSGGGKSTVAALLLGLYQAQKGQVLVDGVVLGQETIPAARAMTGVVLQQPSLLSGTVGDQIRLGAPHAPQEEIERAAKLAHADTFIRTLPKGYDTEVGERGHSLSGGQKQRISLARALIRCPRFLLLDEPTAALDVEAERAVDAALHEFTGCTKLIIAHRLSTVRRADVIAVVSGGRVVEQGSHDELMEIEGGHYQSMVLRSEFEDKSEVEIKGSEQHEGNGKSEVATAFLTRSGERRIA